MLISLQKRLKQLEGAKLTAMINPFGLIDNAKIVKVRKSIIIIEQNHKRYALSAIGMPIIKINRRAQKASKKRFGIGLNFIAGELGQNHPTILKRRIVQIGRDFIETTSNGKTLELIPLTNVNVIFSKSYFASLAADSREIISIFPNSVEPTALASAIDFWLSG